jgi:hypothetical protein
MNCFVFFLLCEVTARLLHFLTNENQFEYSIFVFFVLVRVTKTGGGGGRGGDVVAVVVAVVGGCGSWWCQVFK